MDSLYNYYLCYYYRRKTQAAPSQNTRLDFDGPYDITLQGTQSTNSASNEHTNHGMAAPPPNSNEEAESVYHNVQTPTQDYIYAKVDKSSVVAHHNIIIMGANNHKTR